MRHFDPYEFTSVAAEHHGVGLWVVQDSLQALLLNPTLTRVDLNRKYHGEISDSVWTAIQECLTLAKRTDS